MAPPTPKKPVVAPPPLDAKKITVGSSSVSSSASSPTTSSASSPISSPTSQTTPSPQIQELLAKSEVSVWIDTYDDIFSDFDPRPYRERALSVDFLDEAKRYSKEKQGKLQLRILAPKNIRHARMEAVIKKRLQDYFKHHESLLNDERRAEVMKGTKLIVVGAALLFAAAFITHYLPATLWRELLFVFFEPGGWFCFWVGAEQILYNDKRQDQEFYVKMSAVDIVFESY